MKNTHLGWYMDQPKKVSVATHVADAAASYYFRFKVEPTHIHCPECDVELYKELGYTIISHPKGMTPRNFHIGID